MDDKSVQFNQSFPRDSKGVGCVFPFSSTTTTSELEPNKQTNNNKKGQIKECVPVSISFSVCLSVCTRGTLPALFCCTVCSTKLMMSSSVTSFSFSGMMPWRRRASFHSVSAFGSCNSVSVIQNPYIYSSSNLHCKGPLLLCSKSRYLIIILNCLTFHELTFSKHALSNSPPPPPPPAPFS